MQSPSLSCFFSVLAVTLINMAPTDATSLSSLHHPKGRDLALEKCFKGLEKHQEDSNSFSSQNTSPDNDCNGILARILSNMQAHRAENPFTSKTGGWPSTSEGDLFQSNHLVTNYFGKGAELYARGPSKIKPGPRELNGRSSTLPEAQYQNQDILAMPEISHLPDDTNLSTKSTNNFLRNVPVVKRELNSRSNVLDKGIYGDEIPKFYQPFKNNPKENADRDNVMSDVQLVLYPDDEEGIEPVKRVPGNWISVLSRVAKRRLSVNNALMALTDMVMEHGREKLMRNRDNLRYHMYAQG